MQKITPAPNQQENKYLYHSVLTNVHADTLQALLDARKDISLEEMKTLVSRVLYSYKNSTL